jgi:hypothetical protein
VVRRRAMPGRPGKRAASREEESQQGRAHSAFYALRQVTDAIAEGSRATPSLLSRRLRQCRVSRSSSHSHWPLVRPP